MEKMKAHHL